MRTQQSVLLVVGAVVLAGLVGLAWLIFRSKDDRPPIIVKGGSIHFEGCAGNNGSKKAWKQRKDGHWRPDHKNGKDISQFHVDLVGKADACGLTAAVSKNCGNGHFVQIQYSQSTGSSTQTARFEFDAELNDDVGRWEPTLSADVTLVQNGAYVLDYGSGASTIAATVDGRDCTPAEGTVLRLVPIP